MSNLPLPIAGFIAFLAGLISFLSPCVLPLVPGYVSMISGVGIEELKSSESRLFRKVMLNSAAFILGFSLVFIALGAAATEIGQWLRYYQWILARIAGVVVILFGLHLTGIFQIKALLADTRLHSLKGGSSVFGAFVLGFAFAFGWTPCVGPILGVVLGFASAQDTLIKGILLLAAYSAGLALPFLMASLLVERFIKFYHRFKSFMHAMEVSSGALLIALGALLVTGRFERIAASLSFVSKLQGDWDSHLLENAPALQRNPLVWLIIAAVVTGVLFLAVLIFRTRQSPPTVKRNPLVPVVIAVIVAAMVFAGAHLSRKNRVAMVPASGPSQRQPAPDFELKSLDGSKVKLSDFRGRAVLLNFWATWCGPCKVEMPWFVELQKQYGPQGLQIIGVAMDDAADDEIAKFAKEMGVNYPVLLGTEAVGQSYGGVNVLPTTFFVDRDGKLIAREFGLQSRSVFVDHIKESLGQAVQAQR